MKIKNMTGEVKLPQGVTAEIAGHTVKINGPKGEVERKLAYPKLNIENKDGKVMLIAKNGTKKEKTIIGTFKAHIKNMIKGSKDGHIYKLKICSGHFPMNVVISGNQFSVSNFLGEKTPRTIKIQEEVSVKIEGQEVTVESNDKELAGQTAANIETLTKIKGRDRRIFQDGIYIINKDGKELE